jgi:pimeloyl-ACP methyl ester carboxylesterase
MSNNSTINIQMTTKPIIVTLHGGCFVGGSAEWDKPQTKCIENCGFDVHQLDFPKDNLSDTISYIHEYIKNLGTCVYMLGRSSGGCLAKIFYDKYPNLIEKVVYLDPVFDPKSRGSVHIKFKDKQDHFFRKSGYPDTSLFNKDNEILILAENSENVPRICFTLEQLGNAMYIGIKTHKGVNTTTSKVFHNIIKKLLK